MRNLLRLFLLSSILSPFCGLAAETGHAPVTQQTSGANKGRLDQDIIIGPGRTITISGGTSAGFGGNWGSITGTLADQTDLATALSLKASTASLAAVALSGAYNDLTGKPTLGTAAAFNVPASGNAASGEIVKGSDTRLSDARTPTAHTHPAADISDASANGRSLLTAADYAAMRSLLSLGTAALVNVPASGNAASGEAVKGSDTRLSDARTPTAHTHLSTDISDSTATGRSLMTAASANAALNSLLPPQSGHANGIAQTDGTNVSWGSYLSFNTLATAATSGTLAPSDLTFSYNNSKRLSSPISPNFFQIDGSDFDAHAAPWWESIFSVGAAVTTTWDSGGYKTTYPAAGGTSTRISDTAPVAPYCFCYVTVGQMTTAATATMQYVGLFDGAMASGSDAKYVAAAYDMTTGNLTLFYRRYPSVSETTLASINVGTLTAPFSIGFSLNNRTVGAWTNTGTGWQHQIDAWLVPSTTGYSGSVVTTDLGVESTLATYRYGFATFVQGTAETTSITDFRAGYWQGPAQIMWNPVRFLNGSPYIAAGRAYYTVDNQAFHPGVVTSVQSKWYANAHMGIYTKDLTTGEVEEVGKLFIRRGGMLGDADGSIAIDENNLDVHVLVPNSRDDWTAVNQVLYYGKTNGDILHGVHIVDAPTRLYLGTICTPGGDTGSSYDCAALFRHGDGDFGVLCVTTNELSTAFDGSLLRYPSAFKGSSMTSQLALVNRYTSVTGGGEEGGRLLTMRGTRYAVFGAASSIHIYDLALTTRLASPTVTIRGVSQRSHYGIVEWANAGVTSYDLTAFDFMDYGTKDANGGASQLLHGNVVSFRANQTLAGYEFPIIRDPFGSASGGSRPGSLGPVPATGTPNAVLTTGSYIYPTWLKGTSWSAQRYGIAQLRRWRAAVAKMRDGSGGNPKVLFFGDSTTAGFNGTYVGAKAYAYPTVLAKMLTNAGLPARESSVCGSNVDPAFLLTPSTFDSRVTQNSGWAWYTSETTLGGYFYMNTTNTNSLSFTPAQQFDTIEVYYARVSGNGSFTLNVDGGSTLATVNTSGTPTALVKSTTSCMLGTHTLNLQASTLASGLFIQGINVYDSTAKEIQVINTGVGALKTAGTVVNSAAYSPLSSIDTYAPNLSIISLMINDEEVGTSVSTYQSQLTTLVNRCLLTGDVIMVSPTPLGTSQYNSVGATYLAAFKGVADSMSVPYVDANTLWGTYAANNTNGLMADTLHPNKPGYEDFAAIVADYVVSVSGVKSF